MIVKFFRRGKENGNAPIKYCLDETKERDRPPEVLAGNPETTRELIDSCPHVYKYKSGVINFGTDTPTEKEQKEVMADFERAAFAGLEPDQYNILWVRHVHNGQTELHFVVPRMELTTGKSLNIAPPGHEKFYNLWRDSWNIERGWQRPDAPEHARILRLTSGELKAKAAGKENIKDDITAWLVQRISDGEIADRGGVKSALAELGEITREGKDFISVRLEGQEKPIRLKGAIYERNFESRGLKGEDRCQESRGRGTAEEEERRSYAQLRERLDAAIQGKARERRQRFYRQPEPAEKMCGRGDREGGEIHRSEQPAGGNLAAPDEELVLANSNGGVDLCGYLRSRLGMDSILESGYSGPPKREGGLGSGDDQARPLGNNDNGEQRRSIHNRSAEDDLKGRLDNGQWPEGSLQAREEVGHHDGFRAALREAFDKINRLVREGVSFFTRREQALARITERTSDLCRELKEGSRTIRGGSQELKEGSQAIRDVCRKLGNATKLRQEELSRRARGHGMGR